MWSMLGGSLRVKRSRSASTDGLGLLELSSMLLRISQCAAMMVTVYDQSIGTCCATVP